MKLVVSIPAYNEEHTLGRVIDEIPKKIPGVSEIQVVVVDDCSTDRTFDIARKKGAVVTRNKKNMGLAKSFKKGMEKALELGADIMVNTDADYQYNQKEIPKLTEPILAGRADVVLSHREVLSLSHMPLQKKIGNSLATLITRLVSGYPVKDAQSGFRAFSREAMMRLVILSDYTYVQETIMESVFKGLAIEQVQCEFRKRTGGKSRLISNIWNYAQRAGVTILRTFTYYKPLRVFMGIGLALLIMGMLTGARVLTHYIETGMVSPYVPSAILTAILLIVGFQIIVLGLIADTIDAGRRVSEEVLYRLKKQQLEK